MEEEVAIKRVSIIRGRRTSSIEKKIQRVSCQVQETTDSAASSWPSGIHTVPDGFNTGNTQYIHEQHYTSLLS